MPHAVEPHSSEDARDQALIDQYLQNDPANTDNIDLNRPLEVGEKADDAIDFEDIGDDDLADEVDMGQDFERQGDRDPGAITPSGLDVFMHDGDTYSATPHHSHEDEGLDDLFGDHASPPRDIDGSASQLQLKLEDADDLFDFDDHELPLAQSEPEPAQETQNPPLIPPTTLNVKDAPLSKEQQIQQELFAMSRLGQGNYDILPAPPENQEELLASLWPKFERNKVPKFMELLPPKRARYMGKSIPKAPKPINPTKISLELAADQEKTFKVSSTLNKRALEDMEELGIISVQQEAVDKKLDGENWDMESDFENDTIGGVSWQDLQVLCEDWDTRSLSESVASEQLGPYKIMTLRGDAFGASDNDFDDGVEWPPGKVSKFEFEFRQRH